MGFVARSQSGDAHFALNKLESFVNIALCLILVLLNKYRTYKLIDRIVWCQLLKLLRLRRSESYNTRPVQV